MILENINLEMVQDIVCELEKLKNRKKEYNNDLDELNNKMKEFVNLYYKNNQIIINKQKELKEYQKELNELENQNNVFNANFFRIYKRKAFLKQNITRLNEEIEFTLNNRVEVKKNYDDMITPKVEITKNIMDLDTKISNAIEQINEIYFECRRRIQIINKKIETRKVSAQIAAANRDIFAPELKDLLQEVINLTEEKNICEYDKIVNYIDNITYTSYIEQKEDEVAVKNKSFNFNTKFASIKQLVMNKKIEAENTIFGFIDKVEENSNILLTNVSSSVLNKINNNSKRTLTKKFN